MTIAFLKGHAMNRGTLMVLKRFVIMALGALGLGALAAGPTFAQQIPAPDAYGDPQACAANIKAVTAAADTGEVQDNGLTPMQEAMLMKMARACAPEGGDVVGAGIAKARMLYGEAVEAKKELDIAQEAHDGDDSAGNLEDLTEAMAAHDGRGCALAMRTPAEGPFTRRFTMKKRAWLRLPRLPAPLQRPKRLPTR